jgi:Ca-activated chloride channel family protein
MLMTRAVAACEVALVLALDVSRSVDRDEYALMRDGIASAFLDDEVRQLIEWMPGGLMVTVTQWGGEGQQRQAVAWRRIEGKAGIVRFVEDFTAQTRGFWMADTAVSEALAHADGVFNGPAAKCRRHVIDVSGDGIANAGAQVAPIARAIGNKGVTINGLVITGATPDPVAFFEQQVINGPFAFVETANNYADYPRAMKRKLLRELTPAVAQLAD